MRVLRQLVGKPAFWASGYLFWGIVLYFASSLQGVPGPEIPHLDKIEHAVFFAAGHLVLGLAIATFTATDRVLTNRWRIGVALIVIAGIVGVLDEFHQSFTPGRNGNDPGDIAADVVGGILAAMALPAAWRMLWRIRIGSD